MLIRKFYGLIRKKKHLLCPPQTYTFFKLETQDFTLLLERISGLRRLLSPRTSAPPRLRPADLMCDWCPAAPLPQPGGGIQST